MMPAAAPDASLSARSAARLIRRIILEQSKRANAGHIGSALSIADVIAALFFDVLNIPHPAEPERDRFILSKGHAALALYAALKLRGWITEDDLDSFSSDDSLLGVHPDVGLRGVDFSTGSLGQGLSMGAGAALAARLQGSSRRVFVLVSDAECNEGSLWETVMFAAHHQLANLTAVIDLNGQQALGYTNDVLTLTPMADRWRSFAWDVLEVDGHAHEALSASLNAPAEGAPRVVIARTVFGYGVSFMQQQIRWHYMPMSDDEYHQALKEIES
jgi:transketolase